MSGSSQTKKKKKKKYRINPWIFIPRVACLVLFVAVIIALLFSCGRKSADLKALGKMIRVVPEVKTEAMNYRADSDNRIQTTEKGYVVLRVNGVTTINGVKIANKTYSVPENYGDGITPEAQAAFDQMATAAANDGVVLNIVSGFRSYETQAALFNRYLAEDGVDDVETYSARPGHSEHQLGLAMDLNLVDQSFADTPEGQWVNAHCHEYGFIIRYPADKMEETGFIGEPWHIRYVGQPLADELYNGGDWITVEDHFGITSVY